MKKFFSATFAFALAITLLACANTGVADDRPVTTIAATNNPVGLDLRALAVLAKKIGNAAELEQKLNEENSINNLDLDGDGYIDYLRVEEYKVDTDTRGLMIFDGEQEIARIEVKLDPHGTNASIEGNPDIYGDYYYSYSWYSPWDEYPLFAWLWLPRDVYVSPWSNGFYPGWYQHRRCVPWEMYSHRMRYWYRWCPPRMDRHYGNRYRRENSWRNQWPITPGHTTPTTPPRRVNPRHTLVPVPSRANPRHITVPARPRESESRITPRQTEPRQLMPRQDSRIRQDRPPVMTPRQNRPSRPPVQFRTPQPERQRTFERTTPRPQSQPQPRFSSPPQMRNVAPPRSNPPPAQPRGTRDRY